MSCDIIAIARDISFIVPQPALCEIAEQPLLTKRPKMKAVAKEMDGNDDAQQEGVIQCKCWPTSTYNAGAGADANRLQGLCSAATTDTRSLSAASSKSCGMPTVKGGMA